MPPTQVLIEASIVEVTLTDDMQYGLQWTFNDAQANGKVGTSVLSNLPGGVLGGAAGRFFLHFAQFGWATCGPS